MSIYLLGDIQGCWKSLKALLKEINYRPGQDQLGFVGDVLNRGPHSSDVMHFIMDLNDPLFVLGNHEMYFIMTARGHIPPDRYSHTLTKLFNAPDCADMVNWLMRKPLVQPIPLLPGLMVHAGIPPQWSVEEAIRHSDEFQVVMQSSDADAFLAVCFGDQPDCWAPSHMGHDRVRYIVNALTRIRFCTREGRLDFIEKGATHPEDRHLKPWFEWRKPDSMPLYFGHWAKLQGNCSRPNTFALDTACVQGGRLTAIRIEDHRLFSVKQAE
jgi:bis(5'-nucleosyl)-tetraphosphatase (symmetrical)